MVSQIMETLRISLKKCIFKRPGLKIKPNSTIFLLILSSIIFRGREVVGELGLSDVCEADLSALRYICECVSRRAGFMCAAGLTALIKKMDYKVIIRKLGLVWFLRNHVNSLWHL